MGDVRNAAWQCDVSQVDRATTNQFAQIYFDEFWQVSRQARDIEISQHMRDDRSANFDSWRNLSVHKVQRHFGVHRLVSRNALEIEVHHDLFEGVPLN